jgi:hypothetical protein
MVFTEKVAGFTGGFFFFPKIMVLLFSKRFTSKIYIETNFAEFWNC